MSERLPIGKAAQQSGLSVDTIRFYQKIGLIASPPRTRVGYQMFGSGQLRDLQSIARAQELGFSLKEIKELLLLQREPTHGCLQVRDLLQNKLATVRQKIDELVRMERQLGQALQECQRELRRRRNPAHEGGCPVLADIERHRRVRTNGD